MGGRFQQEEPSIRPLDPAAVRRFIMDGRMDFGNGLVCFCGLWGLD